MNENKYLAIKLCEASKQELLKMFPPVYNKVYADHVTIAFNNYNNLDYESQLGKIVNFCTWSHGFDNLAQCVRVGFDDYHIIDGLFSKYNRPDLKPYHITISTSLSGKPVDSNKIHYEHFHNCTKLNLKGIVCLLQK